MLWYKSWLETRWRFFIGLALLMLSACGPVLEYPRVIPVRPLVPPVAIGGRTGRRARPAAQTGRPC